MVYFIFFSIQRMNLSASDLLWRRMSGGTIFLFGFEKDPMEAAIFVCWVPALVVTKPVRLRLVRLGLHDTSLTITIQDQI